MAEDILEIENFIEAVPFATIEAVEAYLDHDELSCLICGAVFKGLHSHITRAHHMSVDEYKDKFGIPRKYGIAGKTFRANQSRRLIALREAGLIAASPSEEHIAMLHSIKSKPSFAPCIRAIHQQNGLEREAKRWDIADYHEYLARMSTGRTISDVGKDKDLMGYTRFKKYCAENPDFATRLEEVIDQLPNEVQIRGQHLGTSLKGLVYHLHEEHGFGWTDVAWALGLKPHMIRNIYKYLRKKGELEHLRSQSVLPSSKKAEDIAA